MLDSDASRAAPTWIHAGPQRAEAGYQDPALGWVSVRAGASEGGIHASLVPGSADAASALSSHLSALNSYLAGRDIRAATVTVAPPEMHSAGSQQTTQQETGRSFDQGSRQETADNARGQPRAESGVEPRPVAAADAIGMLSIMGAPGEGVHISVMA